VVLHPAIDDLASSESAAPQSTDIGRHSDEGSFVPIGDLSRCSKEHRLFNYLLGGD
jgi:hypothetical protein